MTQRDLYMAYMKGWRHGAGGHAIAPEFANHEDGDITDAYALGYTEGKKACGTANGRATKLYDYKPSIIRLQKKSK